MYVSLKKKNSNLSKSGTECNTLHTIGRVRTSELVSEWVSESERERGTGKSVYNRREYCKVNYQTKVIIKKD